MSWRAVCALFRHARRDSAVYEAKRLEGMGEYAAYTQDTHLLTMVVDELRTIAHYYLSAHMKNPPKPPKPLPRPGVQEHARQEISRSGNGAIAGNHVGSGAVTKDELHRFWHSHGEWLAEQSVN